MPAELVGASVPAVDVVVASVLPLARLWEYLAHTGRGGEPH